ncbi:MAG: hypothetical protein ACOX5K_03475 [Bacteroidales bacterium]|jgi:hypothetical protein|nr:hypothetical protein [Bacteroidota bacterium]
MKNLKTGITFIVLGNVLYLSKDLFSNINPSAFSDFTEGFLMGFGVGLNIIGIILVFVHMARGEKQR